MKKSRPRGSKNEGKVTIGSGNVFADLGLPNAEEEAVRASLVLHLANELESRGLTQRDAAKLLGVDQPTVSRIMRGRFERFSLERIIRFLVSAGRDVKIVIPSARRTKGKSGRLLIEAA
jgi:predicted XRE-type DNA-binding protein